MNLFAVLFDMLNRAEKGEALTPFERAIYRFVLTAGVALVSFTITVWPTVGPALASADFSHLDTHLLLTAAQTSGLITVGMVVLKYFMARGDAPLGAGATVANAVLAAVDPAVDPAPTGTGTNAPVLPPLTNTNQPDMITSSASQVAPAASTLLSELGVAPATAESVFVGSAPTASEAPAPATTLATSPAGPGAQEVPATPSNTSDVSSAL